MCGGIGMRGCVTCLKEPPMLVNNLPKGFPSSIPLPHHSTRRTPRLPRERDIFCWRDYCASCTTTGTGVTGVAAAAAAAAAAGTTGGRRGGEVA